MKLIKYTHSCVRLESEHGVLVLDPSGFVEAEALDGADAVLVTHEHFDHVDPEQLVQAGLPVWAPESVAAQIGATATAVGPGEEFEAAGYTVRTYGGRHATVHPDLVPPSGPPANVAYLVHGVYHPGDSFAAPGVPVDTVLVPVSGPWMKVGEAADFAREVAARRIVPIHDAINSDMGNQLVERVISGLVPGSEYHRLAPGESIEV